MFYPTFDMRNGDPVTVFGNDLNPTLSMLAYTGDLGIESGRSQSVYVLDKTNAKPGGEGRQAGARRPAAGGHLPGCPTTSARSPSTGWTRGSASRSARRPARASLSSA
ncbi:hypothetical protein [Nocardioides convexus]|uniref:hypothetical protein n=1 Tax=Nocardioides convexus TaxID=2712224 RepID=UPI00241879CE|nr:hypothetical protein [Nocardioides convexus]